MCEPTRSSRMHQPERMPDSPDQAVRCWPSFIQIQPRSAIFQDENGAPWSDVGESWHTSRDVGTPNIEVPVARGGPSGVSKESWARPWPARSWIGFGPEHKRCRLGFGRYSGVLARSLAAESIFQVPAPDRAGIPQIGSTAEIGATTTEVRSNLSSERPTSGQNPADRNFAPAMDDTHNRRPEEIRLRCPSDTPKARAALSPPLSPPLPLPPPLTLSSAANARLCLTPMLARSRACIDEVGTI